MTLEDALLEPDDDGEEPKVKEEEPCFDDKDCTDCSTNKECMDEIVSKDLPIDMKTSLLDADNDYKTGRADAKELLKWRSNAINVPYCDESIVDIKEQISNGCGNIVYLTGIIDELTEYREKHVPCESV